MTRLTVGAIGLAVAIVAGSIFLFTRGSSSPTTQPGLGGPQTLAVVHSGAAVFSLQPLGGGQPTTSLKLPGSPSGVVMTPDRKKAFLLDSSHGDVIPVDLVKGQVGASIAVGRLPVDEHLSADGSKLYVTDNIGGIVVPIDTATGTVLASQNLSPGVDGYIPSPTGSSALVVTYTSSGEPGIVYIATGAGLGAQLAVGLNPPTDAFYSPDGKTAWVVEGGTGNQPGTLTPIEVASRQVGTPITLGHFPETHALTPDGKLAVIANSLDGTVSIVDLTRRVVVATVAVGASPSGIAITADGSTAWVANTTDRTLTPIDIHSAHAGTPIPLANSPVDLVLPAAANTAWVLFPSSPGSVTFLNSGGTALLHGLGLGNGPSVIVARDGITAWAANSLMDSVQEIGVGTQTAGPAIPIARNPIELELTPNGRTLLVLSFGDGTHSGYLTAIDTASSKAGQQLEVGPAPTSLTVNPAGDTAFVANHQNNSVTVVDIKAWTTSSIALPCSPSGLVITPDGQKLYAACNSTAQVVPVPLATTQPHSGPPIAVTDSPRLIVDPQGKFVYVIGGHGLQEIDIATDIVLHSQVETGNLVSAKATPEGTSLIAIDNSGAALVQISTSTLATGKSLSLGSRPDHLQVSPDGTRAYVLDTSEQKLYVVDVVAWSVVATVDASPNALSIAVTSPAP
jgi:YVTN family beta-propeller protein